jgi:hypothetical protein
VDDADPERARALGKQTLGFYLQLSNYVANIRRLGFGDADVAGEGSDALLDALVAQGGAASAARVTAHLDAGAAPGAVQPLIAPGGDPRPALRAVVEALPPR